MGLVLIAASAGCGTRDADGSGAAPPTSTAPTADEPESLPTTSVVDDFGGGVDGPVMFVPGPPSDEGEDALIEGVLVRDGDCLFVGDGAPGTRLAVLWPFGTSWDEERQEVITADGTRIPLGASISAGGGYGSPDMASALLDGDALRERADECAEGEYRELAHAQHSIALQDTTTTEPAATAPVAERPKDFLTQLLFDIGAGVNTAPPEAQALDDAALCNLSTDLDSLSNTSADEEQCFRNAIEMSRSAVLVVAFYTDEGDPIVKVQRTDASSTTIRVFNDSSQDAFAGMGAPAWRTYECAPDQITRQGNDPIRLHPELLRSASVEAEALQIIRCRRYRTVQDRHVRSVRALKNVQPLLSTSL